MKQDLEDIRNGAGDVRAFRHIDGHINSVEDYSKHPEGCTCGHCGKDHDHKTMGHVPKHTHGDACGCGHDHDHDHDHEEHFHEHGDDCCCGNDRSVLTILMLSIKHVLPNTRQQSTRLKNAISPAVRYWLVLLPSLNPKS